MLDDAVEQGALFCNMLAELRTQRALLASLKATGETLDDKDIEGQNAHSGR
ncbi:MAG: Glycerol-3-phosphate ABC transporter, permease protein UgpE (TC 3.A.1.1.3) [uncultured Caballeronia sp.]|nr:MAG: Glycerol-3-phosphate ABC transporter, permease protein UgpE (TC 3.A.1.1.3) [uncultured Caballeronia sp.]